MEKAAASERKDAKEQKKNTLGGLILLAILAFVLFLVFYKPAADSPQADDNSCAFSVKSMNNDTTGNFMVATTTGGALGDDETVEYYKTCFQNDQQIHYLVNFSTNTTTKLSIVGGMLDRTVYEYADGEEHDAKKIGSGLVLGEDYFNKTTGEKIVLDGGDKSPTTE